MAVPHQNAPDAMCAEILADARRQADEILRRACEQAEKLRSQAAAEAEEIRQERLSQARAEAERVNQLTLATVQIDVDRLRSARVETLLNSIQAEVRRRLAARNGFDYRESVVRLAADAIRRMSGSNYVVKLAPGGRVADDRQLSKDIARLAGCAPQSLTVSTDPSQQEVNSVFVQDAEARQIWDNSPHSRLDRCWPELRRQIALRTALVAKSEASGGEQ